eukprot:3285339-Alexandrium_andersonii.AAC.1
MAVGLLSLLPTGRSVKKLLQAAAARRVSGGGYRPPGPPDCRLWRERPPPRAPPPQTPPKTNSDAPGALFGWYGGAEPSR